MAELSDKEEKMIEKMSMKEIMEKAKTIYFMDDFRAFMRKNVQGFTDEDFKKPVSRIKQLILESKGKDPAKMFYDVFEQVEKEWTLPAPVPVHNEWHHFVVPGVVLASMRNCGYGITDKDIVEGMARGEKFAGGSCGFAGTCGGAYSAGIVASVVGKTTVLHDEERVEIMKLVVETLNKISQHGRRCCKRSSFISIESVVNYLSKKYILPLSQIECKFSAKNKMCLGKKCPYHKHYKTNQEVIVE